jgi:hypothetical protein
MATEKDVLETIKTGKVFDTFRTDNLERIRPMDKAEMFRSMVTPDLKDKISTQIGQVDSTAPSFTKETRTGNIDKNVFFPILIELADLSKHMQNVGATGFASDLQFHEQTILSLSGSVDGFMVKELLRSYNTTKLDFKKKSRSFFKRGESEIE